MCSTKSGKDPFDGVPVGKKRPTKARKGSREVAVVEHQKRTREKKRGASGKMVRKARTETTARPKPGGFVLDCEKKKAGRNAKRVKQSKKKGAERKKKKQWGKAQLGSRKHHRKKEKKSESLEKKNRL